ncbi:hypothetical protein QN277_016613 [Acacia crassicarpa]|uniref:PGG domain-containing protein n=1 Tax=Acacia crassicarpa TaxID=499986 RepID=A0AAE1MX06_9FABA|nr:hypothetical protein QN277_016613 [Acacia crassicarpa]
MDPRLVKSAQLGDTDELNELLEGDPLILNRVALSQIAETPLHIATLAGKANYVRKLLSLKPCFAEELNKDGFTALHIAAATGHREIVRELLSLKLGTNLCLLKDKFGLNPLHHAAIRGRVGVIQELVSFCPDAAKQVTTAQGETALHLAVKNHQLEAVRVLVKLCGEDVEIMSLKDKDGRTALEIAIATKQLQVLELLGFRGKTNKESTTLEVLLSETQFETPKPTTQDGNNADTTQTSQQTEENSKNIWESLDNMVLVVASLIATVTYQAGLSPPETIWKEDMKNHPKCIFHGTNTSHSCPDVTYYLFMSFNTSGFFASCFLIFFYRKGSYVRVLLPVALISMMITYITLSVSMSPNVLSLLILYLITLVIFLYCILAIEMVKKVIQKMFSYAHDRASKLAKLAYEKYKLAGSSGEHP